ncbi:hypothetical protein NW852_06725, partial [Synechococcus sp. H60.1]
AVPLPSDTDEREAGPDPLLDWLLRDGEPVFEDDPDPVRENPQPEPTPTSPPTPAPPPVAAPAPPPTPILSTPLPPQPVNRPLFPPSTGPLLLLLPFPPLPKTLRPASYNACAKSGNAWGRTKPKKRGSLRIPWQRAGQG